MLSLVELAGPLEPAGVEPVAQDRMDGAHGHLRPALAIDETGVPRHARYLLQRVLAGRVPLEELGNDGRLGRIWRDDLLAVRTGDVPVAERRLRGPDALFSLLLHALASFLRQIVDVVLRHQHLDAV